MDGSTVRHYVYQSIDPDWYIHVVLCWILPLRGFIISVVILRYSCLHVTPQHLFNTKEVDQLQRNNNLFGYTLGKAFVTSLYVGLSGLGYLMKGCDTQRDK